MTKATIEKIRPEAAMVLSPEQLETDNPDSGLPEGAVKVTDPEVYARLYDMKLLQIEISNRNLPSNSGSKFADRLCAEGLDASEIHDEYTGIHPRVEGYAWYRGYEFRTTEGEVYIFTSWMQPWYPGGAPVDVVYTDGGPSVETVRSIVEDHYRVALSTSMRSQTP